MSAEGEKVVSRKKGGGGTMVAYLVVREELFVRADSSQSLFLKVIL